MIKDDQLITPSLTDSVLESITRDSIIRIAKKKGIEVAEQSIDRTELYTCDEAFLCGSAMEITPLLSVDRYEINGGEAGKLTTELHRLYLDAARGLAPEFKAWLTPVY